MKRGGGEDPALSEGGRGAGDTAADGNSFLLGGSSGGTVGDIVFTPGRVVVDKDDQLVRYGTVC